MYLTRKRNQDRFNVVTHPTPVVNLSREGVNPNRKPNIRQRIPPLGRSLEVEWDTVQ